MEKVLIYFGFFLIGIVFGFLTLLILRMFRDKYTWKGVLTVIITLGGGGFISYITKPIHFGLYSIGFFIGFVGYIIYLIFLYDKLKLSRTGESKNT